MKELNDILRKEMLAIRPYVQGKPAEVVRRELGLEKIEKLASNENQFGPSPMAIDAMREELSNLNFYPESFPYELVEKLSEKLGVAMDRFVVAGGGEALLWYISMAFLDEGDEIVTSSPTFDIYRLAASFLGANTVAVPLKGNDIDIEAMVAAITDKTKIFWLCTPNNPTGNIATKEQLDYIMKNVPEDVLLVLDEAYYEFATARDDYPRENIKLLEERKNIALLRTFSKIYGLAGARVGYIMTDPEIAKRISSIMLTFGVNRLAQVGAKAALDDDGYLESTIRKNKESVDFLEKYFEDKGWNYIPSYTNFCWVDCGLDSKKVFEDLQKKGVIIRPGFLWGYETCLRISTGTSEQMNYFAEKMDEVIAEWDS